MNKSLTIGSGLFLIGVLVILFGIQADIAGKHRRLTEETLYRLRKLELAGELEEEGDPAGNTFPESNQPLRN